MQQMDALQNKLSTEQTRGWKYEEQIGRLLAEKTIVKAQIRLATTVKTEEERLSYEELQIEQERVNKELEMLQKKHVSTLTTLKKQQEEMGVHKLESEKMKTHLTTEMSLLKAQIAQLEKEKNELKVCIVLLLLLLLALAW